MTSFGSTGVHFYTPSPSGGGHKKRLTCKSSTKKRKEKVSLSRLVKEANESRVLRDAKLVSMCNHVLASAGLVATVRTPSDVRAVCASTSVLVASFEAVVGEKLTDVVRRPANNSERAFNCNLVIRRLEEKSLVGTDLKHIDGERITSGNLQDIYDLLEILSALGEKWTFATPIKTPSRSAAQARSAARSARKSVTKTFSLRKKLVLDDEDDAEDRSSAAEFSGKGKGMKRKKQRAKEEKNAVNDDANDGVGERELDDDEEDEEDDDDNRSLKEKLQELLLRTVEQKQKHKAARRKQLEQQGSIDNNDADEAEALTKPKTTTTTRSSGKTKKAAMARKKRVAFGSNKENVVLANKSNKGNGAASLKDAERDAKEFAELLVVHDKVTKYVEFDRAMRKLDEMRLGSTELESRLIRVARDSVKQSERRMATMRSSWLRSQRAAHRHLVALEEKRERAQQRGLLHSARVESIKARRFQNRVEQLRQSNESRYESAEVDIFRGIFNKAIECEKEVILERRREASKARRTNAVTRARDRTLEKEKKLRKHFDELTEQFKMELIESRKAEKQEDLLNRMYEKEERMRIAQERDKAMEYLAPFRVGAFESISIKNEQVDSMKFGVKKYMRKVNTAA